MFLIFALLTFAVVVVSIIGLVKHSKKQKSVEEEWAKFVEKHPSNEERDKKTTPN